MTGPAPDAPDRVQAYVADLFAPQDALLEQVLARQRRLGLPEIEISAEEGKLFQVLLAAVGAKRVLEVGTLGGYSGVWIARALPPDGQLVTIELDEHHAEFARETFALTGVAERVTLIVGDATEVLLGLPPPFDAVFLDADKENMPLYYREAMRLLRTGGLLLGDNALWDGRVAQDDDRTPETEAMRTFNRSAAQDERLVATILPVRDGVLLGVKRAD